MKFNDEPLIRSPKLVTSLIVLFFTLVFAGLATLLYHTFPADNVGISKWSAVGGYFQGIVGSAISIGTMISTVSLAFLALQIVRQQERREVSDGTQSFLAEGIRPLFRIARELNAVLYSSERLLESVKSRPTTNSDSREFLHFSKSLIGLCAAIESVEENPYSNAILREAGNRGIRLLRRLGLEEAGKKHAKLAFWSNALRARILQLEATSSPDTRELLSASLTLSEEALQKGTNPESEITQTIVFGGHVIWSVPSSDGKRLINGGAALLLDIADALPKAHEIEAMIERQFFAHEDWFLDKKVPKSVKQLIHHNALEDVLLADVLSDLHWFAANWQQLEISNGR